MKNGLGGDHSRPIRQQPPGSDEDERNSGELHACSLLFSKVGCPSATFAAAPPAKLSVFAGTTPGAISAAPATNSFQVATSQTVSSANCLLAIVTEVECSALMKTFLLHHLPSNLPQLSVSPISLGSSLLGGRHR
jgi:hypothetical protein